MNKQYHYISGLPRSGSTLLVNILNQNPEFYASGTSGLYQIIKPITTGWDNVPEFLANSSDEHKKSLLKGSLDGYYACKDEPVIFDKSRSWPGDIELLEYITDDHPKIILCVRDVRDILASWENMYRNDKSQGKATPGEEKNPIAFQTIESRCEFWARPESPLGAAFNIMRDAFHRKHSNNMYYFVFEEWTKNPQVEFKKLYEWLGENHYEHDFDNVKQVIHEKDEYYGYNDLHTIKEGKIIPSQPKWPQFLTKELSQKYKGSNIWLTE